MSLDTNLAARLRARLTAIPTIEVEEKRMFGGLAFMVNGKMCINVSDDGLMCRYDPVLRDEVSTKAGYQPMIMKGKDLNGYCYVGPEGFQSDADFDYWVKLCLDFNERAKSVKK